MIVIWRYFLSQIVRQSNQKENHVTQVFLAVQLMLLLSLNKALFNSWITLCIFSSRLRYGFLLGLLCQFISLTYPRQTATWRAKYQGPGTRQFSTDFGNSVFRAFIWLCSPRCLEQKRSHNILTFFPGKSQHIRCDTGYTRFTPVNPST